MVIDDPQHVANLLYVASGILALLFVLGLIWVLSRK